MLALLLTNIVTFTRPGPGTFKLCDNGTIIDDFSFPVTIPRVNGMVTQVEFQRLGPGQPLELNYALENLLTVPVNDVFESWRDRQYWSIMPFQGNAPIARNRLNDNSEPLGWTYVHFQAFLSPYDGDTDFGGTSGYSGQIVGITNPEVWESCTEPTKLARFEGSGETTIYFTPRFTQTASSFPSGHWGVWSTTWQENITTLNIRVTYE